VPEECREHRQACLHVDAGPIPADQDVDRERVAQVVDPGPAPPGRCVDAGQDQQLGEGLLHASLLHPMAGDGDEEAGRDRGGTELVASCGVAGEHRRGRGVQRHQAGLVILAGHPQHGIVQVDIPAVEGERLAQAQSAGRDQADQCLGGGRRQGRRDRAGRVHERRDFGG
jgi:hypothetical protein